MEKQNTQYLVAIGAIVVMVALVLFVSRNFKSTSSDYYGEALKVVSSSASPMKDTDADGIKDYVETSGALGYVTNTKKADTDSDGYRDLFEYYTKTDPTDATNYAKCYDEDGGVVLTTESMVVSYTTTDVDRGDQNVDECETTTSSWPVACYTSTGALASSCNSVTVLEWQCTSSGSATALNYNCPSGKTCSSGACV